MSAVRRLLRRVLRGVAEGALREPPTWDPRWRRVFDHAPDSPASSDRSPSSD